MFLWGTLHTHWRARLGAGRFFLSEIKITPERLGVAPRPVSSNNAPALYYLLFWSGPGLLLAAEKPAFQQNL
eukprot:6536712-Pyramimonas_sp.AAC.1